MATEAFEEIADTFEFLDDWEDRYRHVIDMGKAMAPLDDAFKVEATKVDGCASQVWILPRIEGEGPGARFDFEGDSDAIIVRGLIAVLHALYSGLPVREVGEASTRRRSWGGWGSTSICRRSARTGCGRWWGASGAGGGEGAGPDSWRERRATSCWK
jgi:cysteine desulfuration protein SufE